jgi:23S rRNA (cytosine1962-C5)-methyltransferase
MTATVTINKRGAERVRAQHLWIYRSDVSDDGGARPGEIVRVLSPNGQVLGHALYSSCSQIALRMISFDDREIDRQFWLSRLAAAAALREQVVSGATAYRLVYGESDLLPSLIIDRYNDCFVIQTLSQGMDALKQMWVELLIERYAPQAIIERNEVRVRELEGLPRIAGLIYGSDPAEVMVEENGIRFAVDPRCGQKTGAFLDQRENRLASENYARGCALDCFTFQGGFALHLARRAQHVTAVDISEAAINQARRNAMLNGLANIDFVEANVFDYLREMDIAGKSFDTIILDPPAFARSRGAIEGALRGYKEINLRAMKLLNSGGFLITSSCSFHMSEEMFLNLLAEAANDVGRQIRIIEKRTQARDHPILLSMPETYYLKCIILQVE